MKMYCFLNGSVIPLDEASVSVYDIGLTRGFGIYEGIKTYNGKVFRLRDHFERLEGSAKMMDIEIPYSEVEIENAIKDCMTKSELTESNIRILVTGGQTISGIEYDKSKPTFVILVEPQSALPKEWYESGAILSTYDHQRMYPEFKTTNYITAVLLQKERKEKKAVEILYTNKGKVLEAATSNFGIFKGDTLIMPKNNVLPGITGKVVRELAKDHFKVEERDILIEELNEAGEAFITATYKEVVPIVKIDDLVIGDGKVGKNTGKIMSLFRDYCSKT